MFRETIYGTYGLYLGGYDWGCNTSKVILYLDQVLEKLSLEDFKVQEIYKTVKKEDKEKEVILVKEERSIQRVYYSDEQGNQVEHLTQYAVLELKVHPSAPTPFLSNPDILMNVWSDPYFFEMTHPLLSIESKPQYIKSNADDFSYQSYQTKHAINYQYAEYVCHQSDTLVVWLHGLGEGGVKDTDPRISVLSNKVTSLCSPKFQEKVGGATILVPQCPTYWMDFDGRQFPEHLEDFEDRKPSLYLDSLFEMIDTYKKENNYKHIVLAGCSNGGYMTLLLALYHPTYFDAIVPICEAIADEYIPTQKLRKIKDLPMFFIYSKDDPVVVPSLYEEPTIQRLKRLHASHLYVSTSEHVIDLSGVYKDENNNSYKYNGHFSWIYFFNNDAYCDTTKLSVWDFIKNNVKK